MAPLRRSSLNQPPPPPEPEAPSLWDRIGGLRGVAATAARVIPGWIGSTMSMVQGYGTVAGAALGAGGEGLAELIEDPTELPS